MHDQTKIMRIHPETDRSTLADAELVASYAREALELGRYPLGAELARLADRAARVGARPAGHDAARDALFGQRVTDVPLIGQTREEPALDTLHRQQPSCDELGYHVSCCVHLSNYSERVTDVPLIGQTREEAPREGSRAPQVCTYRSEVNGSGQLCHQPVAWAEARWEGGGHVPGGWCHLDPEITDHAPEVAGY